VFVASRLATNVRSRLDLPTSSLFGTGTHPIIRSKGVITSIWFLGCPFLLLQFDTTRMVIGSHKIIMSQPGIITGMYGSHMNFKGFWIWLVAITDHDADFVAHFCGFVRSLVSQYGQ
jgi:hypothetical protein